MQRLARALSTQDLHVLHLESMGRSEPGAASEDRPKVLSKTAPQARTGCVIVKNSHTHTRASSPLFGVAAMVRSLLRKAQAESDRVRAMNKRNVERHESNTAIPSCTAATVAR